MILFLCRHGETTGDVEDRYGGDYEDHLTEKGKAQANELAGKLVGKKIEIIWTSPRIRAFETAEIINNKLHLEVKIIDEFRERNHYGILTGMTKAEAIKQYPKEVEAVRSYKTAATGGDEYENFGKRVNEGLKKIVDAKMRLGCLVTHGGPIRFIFREILKFGEISIADCAYAELELGDKGINILSLNGIMAK